MMRSESEFYDLVKQYKVLLAHYNASWEDGTAAETREFELATVSNELMVFPCSTVDMMVRKVTFILSDERIVDWLGYDNGGAVRALLSSFMCLKEGA
ncbi:hypothetical protein LH464_04870 [Neorhizobium sp. T786]|uniref:hypothetical protein n=1 Tax=Pseudorhizobium xiangyangii TaxID=2883104 RepID=UPI001CFFA6A4|nr:hypothetical protein [Neorhizobium xiangyangii]MCB5201809.1 hypothetical protein [Neorhizobium xiangyangii]